MPKEDLYPEEPAYGFKPMDPSATTPTGVNEQGLTSDDVSQANPREQAQYEQILSMAEEMILGEKAKTAQIVEKMNDSRRPVHETVGDVAAMIGGIIIASMESSGEEPDQMAILTAAEDYVIPTLFELGEVSGVLPQMEPEKEQEEMKLAILHAQSVYGNKMIREGNAPTAEARQLVSDQLEKEGQGYSLDQFLKDAGGDQEQAVRQPMGGPPSQLKPLASAMSGGGPPGEDLFNG